MIFHFAWPLSRSRRLGDVMPGFPIKRSLCILVMCFFLSACDKTLYGALTEQEANEVVALLQQEGISADKLKEGDTGFAVKVDETDSP